MLKIPLSKLGLVFSFLIFLNCFKVNTLKSTTIDLVDLVKLCMYFLKLRPF